MDSRRLVSTTGLAAKEKDRAQNKLLMEICANLENVSAIDLNEVLKKINRSLSKSDFD